MGVIRSYSSRLNRSRLGADAESATAAADVFDTTASMLERVQEFAVLALKDELNGGHFQDQAAEVLDAISDAIGTARNAEGKIR